MPPKRKSDVLEPVLDPASFPGAVADGSGSNEHASAAPVVVRPSTKKAQVSGPGEGPSSGKKKQEAAASKNWWEVVLEEGEVSAGYLGLATRADDRSVLLGWRSGLVRTAPSPRYFQCA